jgi:hypothetical protein
MSHYTNLNELSELKIISHDDRRKVLPYHNEMLVSISDAIPGELTLVFHRNKGTWSGQGFRMVSLVSTPSETGLTWAVSGETWTSMPGPRPGSFDNSTGPASPTTTYKSSADPLGRN